MLAARVLKPQGVKGEVKLLSLADSPSALSGVKEYRIKDKIYAVEKYRSDGSFAYVKFVGIDDRNAAELLRDAELYIEERNRPKLPEGRYFIADLIGSTVSDEHGPIGELYDIMQYGSADVYCVREPLGREFMFPAIESVIVQVDTSKKTIAVNGGELSKVAVYED